MSTKSALTLGWRNTRLLNQISRNLRRHEYPFAARIVGHNLEFYSSEARQQDTASTVDSVSDLKKHEEQIESLNKEVESLKERNDELLDKYKRALADGENLRTRLTKQIQDAKAYGIQTFSKDMIEVADILGTATDAVQKKDLDENAPLKNLYEGLTLTKATMLHVFKRHGLEPVNPINHKFDPNIHEALFQKPDATVEPNTIVEVTKLGYTLHGRVIRPALVGVSKEL